MLFPCQWLCVPRPYDTTFYAEIGDIVWEEKSDEEVFTAAELAKADLGF